MWQYFNKNRLKHSFQSNNTNDKLKKKVDFVTDIQYILDANKI